MFTFLLYLLHTTTGGSLTKLTSTPHSHVFSEERCTMTSEKPTKLQLRPKTEISTLLFGTNVNVLTCQGCTCESLTSYRWALSFEHVKNITLVKQTALLVLCSFSSMSHHTRHKKAVILYRNTNEQQHWRPATSQRSITKVAREPIVGSAFSMC